MSSVLRRILLVVLIIGVGIFTVLFPKLFHSKRLLKSESIRQEETFQADSLNQENIIKALRKVIDPEVGINIYDLGLISDIKIENGNKVIIGLLLTTPNCPLINELQSAIKLSVKKIPKVQSVKIFLDKKEPWTPERMTQEGKQQFKSGKK